VISDSRLSERRDIISKVIRKRYGAEFKAKVALEGIKGELPLAESSAKYSIHQTMIATRKRQAIEGLASIITTTRRLSDWFSASLRPTRSVVRLSGRT
jgi:transposase-like protein